MPRPRIILKLILSGFCCYIVIGFNSKPSKNFPICRPLSAQPENGEVVVRFVNTEIGSDVVHIAREGDNLLQVADKAGVHIPRSCRADTCGTCTVDMCDPNAAKVYTEAKGVTDRREGFQTIRACVSRVVAPDGMNEMVIDLFRARLVSSISSGVNPMERFSLDWEKKYQGIHIPESDLRRRRPGLSQAETPIPSGSLLEEAQAHALQMQSKTTRIRRQTSAPRSTVFEEATMSKFFKNDEERTLKGDSVSPSVGFERPSRERRRFSRKDWNS